MMSAGDILILQTTFRLDGAYSGTPSNVVRWGLTEDFDPGIATTRVGGGLGTRADGGTDYFDLEDQDWNNSTQLGEISNFYDGPNSGSDWISWELRITKSATANEFDVVNTLIDLEGAIRDSLKLEYTITSTELWTADSLYPIFQAGPLTTGFSGWEIDNLIVGQVPEPSTVVLLGLGGLVMVGMYRRMRTA